MPDPQRNNKSCDPDSNIVFRIKGELAQEQTCRKACNEDENCVTFSGIWKRWCTGCNTEMTFNNNGTIAFKKIGI